MNRLVTYSDDIRLASNTAIADVDVVITTGKIGACQRA
jgi:hypothetical protein